MTHSPASLPLAADFQLAISKLEILWNLVPRSARPLHKNLREELEKVFDRCVRYTEARVISSVANGSGNSEEGEDPDEAPLAIIMRMMRTLSPEQFLQVKILMMMRDLSDEGRFEVFEEISGSHHLSCGGEVFSDEVHECDLDDDTEGADEGAADQNTDRDGNDDDVGDETEGSPAP